MPHFLSVCGMFGSSKVLTDSLLEHILNQFERLFEVLPMVFLVNHQYRPQKNFTFPGFVLHKLLQQRQQKIISIKILHLVREINLFLKNILIMNGFSVFVWKVHHLIDKCFDLLLVILFKYFGEENVHVVLLEALGEHQRLNYFIKLVERSEGDKVGQRTYVGFLRLIHG